MVDLVVSSVFLCTGWDLCRGVQFVGGLEEFCVVVLSIVLDFR